MNNNQRHARYRRMIMRRRRIRMILIISGILIAVLATVFLIVGSSLAKKHTPPPTDEPEEEIESREPDAVYLPETMKGLATVLETADSSTLSGRLRALEKAGATAASVAMNRPDGTLCYRSATASSLGLLSEEVSVTITNAARLAKEYDLRLSGVYYLTFPSVEDDRLRSVARAKDAAVLSEALSDGMDDILLLCEAADKEDVAELTLLYEEVRRLSEDGALGLCLSQKILTAKGSAVAVDDLSSAFDFLAVSAADYGENDPAAFVETVAAERLDFLLRYRMRILLPSLEDETAQNAVITAAEQYSAKRWQILP